MLIHRLFIRITTITSTTSYKLINYKDLYFNHSSLRNNTGNPTYDDLQDFYKQVKANAASVLSNLGGSLHGQLGLVTNTTNYAQISNTPYVQPAMPDPIGPNNQGNQHQLTENTRFHRTAITMFHTANHTERKIINQIQEALDETVIMPRIIKDIGILEGPVPELMQYLLSTFGDIYDKNLHKERVNTNNHKYLHEDLVTNLFNTIHKYASMAEAYGKPEIEEQLISIGKIIITNSRIFEDYVKKRNALPSVSKHGLLLKFTSPDPSTTITSPNQLTLLDHTVTESPTKTNTPKLLYLNSLSKLSSNSKKPNLQPKSKWKPIIYFLSTMPLHKQTCPNNRI